MSLLQLLRVSPLFRSFCAGLWLFIPTLCGAAQLPATITGLKVEIANKPDAWKTVEWVAVENDIYIVYAGDLHKADGTLETFTVNVVFTGQDGYLIQKVEATDYGKNPVASHTESNVSLSAAAAKSLSYTVIDGSEQTISGKVVFVPVEMERDVDVADNTWEPLTGKLTKALPGHKMNIRINGDKLPNVVALSDFEWTLPNATFKNYEADQTKGKITPVADADRKHVDVHFYFVDSGDKEMKVKCKLNGENVTFSKTLTIEKPTATFTTKLGKTALNAASTRMGLFAAGGSTSGIDYTGKVTVPAGWPEGSWHWVQLVVAGRTKTDAAGKAFPWSLNGQKVLDTTYPYEPAPYGSHPGTTGAYATNTQHTNHDAPSDFLTGYVSFTAADSFEMFMMFLPDGKDSRYVPLQSITWTWGGTATLKNGTWGLTNPTQTVTAAADTTTHPTWTGNIKNGSY